MKTRSLFQIILLSVFAALAMAGVIVFAFAVGGAQTTNNIGKVVIWGTLDKNVFNTVLEQASQTNQQLQQVTYVQKDPATYEQDIANALAQKTGPDIFILSSEELIQDEAKVTPIPYAQFSQVVFQSQYVDAANVFLGPSGVDAFPFAIDPLVLYWNRDILATAGYSEPPKYWEDVLTMAPKITVKDQNGNITTSAIAFGTYENIENAKAILSALFLQKGVGITTRSSTGMLSAALSTQDASGQNQGAQDALAYYTGFADPSQSYYSWNDAMQSAREAFAAGDVALYVGYASEAPLINAMNPNLNLAIAPLPQFENAPRATDFGRVYAFAVPLVSNNQNGALMAAELLDSATTTTQLTNLLGISPARRDVLAQPSQGYGTLFNQMAIQTRTWADPDPSQTETLFRAMIDSTVSGASSASQAVQSGDQQMSQIIGQ